MSPNPYATHYPSWRYHHKNPARLVKNAEDHDALVSQDASWRDTPYTDADLVVDRSSGPNVEPKMNAAGEVGMGDTKAPTREVGGQTPVDPAFDTPADASFDTPVDVVANRRGRGPNGPNSAGPDGRGTDGRNTDGRRTGGRRTDGQ